MFRTIIAATVALFATVASAQTFTAEDFTIASAGVHLGSWHEAKGYNNVNPGLYVVTETGYTAGAYCNSESKSPRFKNAKTCQVSAYIGKTWTWEVTDGMEIGATAGLISGYERGIFPFVIPSVRVALTQNLGARVLYAPAVDPKGTQVVSLTLDYKF